MNFNKHSNLEGQHAFLSASKYSWVNYDDDRLMNAFANYKAAERGTELHEFAAQCIKLGKKLQRSGDTLNMYVNDAIGFKMSPEVVLYYSDNCFGTADAISFRKNFLRIHDFKSGVTPAHIEQVEIYAALFCLEYAKKPNDIEMELRIYQSGDILICNPDPKDISDIMQKIVHFDSMINKIKSEERQ